MNKMKNKKIVGKIVGKTVRIVFLVAFLIYTVTPFIWMILTSLKTKKEMYNFPVVYLPKKFYLGNYIEVFSSERFDLYFLNSMVVAIGTAVLVLVITAMAAYILARVPFKGRGLALGFFLMTQMLPPAVGFAPTYQLMAKLGMIDKISTVIIILMSGQIAFNIILLLGFFKTVPAELEEAAMIDGCNKPRAFLHVVLPLVVPGLFTVMIFTFLAAWNDVMTSVLYINSAAKKTLPVAIYSLIGKYDMNWGTISAGTLFAMVPAIILFSLLKNFFVESIAAGAVKG